MLIFLTMLNLIGTQVQQSCCQVVHPLQCQTTPMYPYQQCYRRSHQECSKICTSKFVHLTPTSAVNPTSQNRCQYIKSYPYVYCGSHTIESKKIL